MSLSKESNELSGQHILLTRPAPQVYALAEKVRALRGEPIVLPTIGIRPIPPSQSQQEIQQLCRHASIIVFISPNAVASSLPYIEIAQLNPATRIAAMGPGTQAALAQAGIKTDILPIGQYNTEGLLAHPDLHELNQQPICIFRGSIGRGTLKEVLIEKGAFVNEVITYQQVIPEYDDHTLKQCLSDSKIDIIVVTSINALKNLMILAKRIKLDVTQPTLLLSSERIASEAKHLGFNNIAFANNATDDAILDALIKTQ